MDRWGYSRVKQARDEVSKCLTTYVSKANVASIEASFLRGASEKVGAILDQLVDAFRDNTDQSGTNAVIRDLEAENAHLQRELDAFDRKAACLLPVVFGKHASSKPPRSVSWG